MHAAVIDGLGGPDELKLRELPTPRPGPGEVLIAIDTAGVATWDAEIRAEGLGNKQPHFPFVLGTDGAGTVAALGAGVRGFTVGDAVYSYSWDNPAGGFYAEYVAVAADRVAHVPRGMDLLHAGAMGTTALTAIQGIDDALHLRRGETIVIHGASGGVGLLAIQFAKQRGARVLATASGPEAREMVRSLGADEVADGRGSDLAAKLARFAPQGADAVLGLAGGDALEICADALRQGGRLAYPEGVRPVPKPRMGLKIIPYNAVSGVKQYARLERAIGEMKFTVPIAGEFALADAKAAHERLAAGRVLGKLVLRVRR
jgi:NADPH:quinone reductase-like Zn-dependent oxidoreductase